MRRGSVCRIGQLGAGINGENRAKTEGSRATLVAGESTGDEGAGYGHKVDSHGRAERRLFISWTAGGGGRGQIQKNSGRFPGLKGYLIHFVFIGPRLSYFDVEIGWSEGNTGRRPREEKYSGKWLDILNTRPKSLSSPIPSLPFLSI